MTATIAAAHDSRARPRRMVSSFFAPYPYHVMPDRTPALCKSEAADPAAATSIASGQACGSYRSLFPRHRRASDPDVVI